MTFNMKRGRSFTLAALLGTSAAGCGNNPLDSVFGDINFDDVYLNVGTPGEEDILPAETRNYSGEISALILKDSVDFLITNLAPRQALGTLILYNEDKIVDSLAVPLNTASVQASFYTEFPAGRYEVSASLYDLEGEIIAQSEAVSLVSDEKGLSSGD